MLNTDLHEANLRFQRWMREACLPLWAGQGIDPASGGHYERLTPEGLPDREVSIRVRVQARQAFAFAFAHCKGWLEEGDVLSLRLLRFIEEQARHTTAADGYTHLMDADFQVIDARQDLYDHAFMFLAFAWIYRATGRKSVLDRAQALLAYFDKTFGAVTGGWYEGNYDVDCRRQNPHMHLFEAFMALYEASGDSHWLARASEMFSLFQSRFFDRGSGALLEFFTDDWVVLGNDKGRIIEPGHMVEWVWLLRWYSALSGRNVDLYADALYERAYAIGFDARSGLMYDETYIDGAPRAGTKRCWPMTEVIKANIAQARAGRDECEQRAADAIHTLFDYFLDVPVKGAYLDQRGADNEVVSAVAPASTLYHLVVACAEVSHYCSQVRQQEVFEKSA